MAGTEFLKDLAGKFLEAYITTGGRIMKACELVGISYGQVQRWRMEEPEFKTAMEDARTISTMVLEEEALRLSLDGEEMQWLDGDGNVVRRTVKRYPQLLMFMLEARDPGQYRKTIKVDGQIGITARPVLEGVASSAAKSFEMLAFGNKVERVYDVDAETGATSPAKE